jgi:hypothetical protein
MAYWVFQHLGNLTPEQLAEDRFVERVRSSDAIERAARARRRRRP